jgi:hypothetical protein
MSEPFEDGHMDDTDAGAGGGHAHADASQLAADALRLLGTAQDWARQTFAEVDAQAHADGHAGPECQWCPLCQFVAVLRGERPELTERVAEAGAALATVLRAALDAATGAAAGAGAGSGQHRAPDEPPAPRVQRIDLGPEDGTEGHGRP